MSITAINNDELLKRKDLDQLSGIIEQDYAQQAAQVPSEYDNSFAGKYGENATIFDVASGKISPRTTNAPSFQTMGAQAGSSANPVSEPTNNSGTSLEGALRLDNLPPTPTVAPVQQPTLSSALTATGSSDSNNPQGGATSQDGGAKRFGASDIFALTGGLNPSGTVKVSDGANPPSEPKATGEATLTTSSNAAEPKATGEATLTTTSEAKEPEATGEATITTASETPETGETAEAGETGEASGEANTANKNDSANETAENNDKNGAGEGGADGSGNTATQVAMKQDEQQVQKQQEEQQRKVAEMRDKEAA